MRVAVPKEIKDGEKRVALVPDIISKLTKAGLEVVIESGAGVSAQAADQDFIAVGAQVKSGDVISGADVILSVQPLTPSQSPFYHQLAQLIQLLPLLQQVSPLSHLNQYHVSPALNQWMH
jgi:NAD/NADP transhydrogenase alpha subunit